MSIPTKHSDPQMCRQCRGLCCQGHPGVWVDPQRFFRIFNLAPDLSPEALQPLLPQHRLRLRDIDGISIPAPDKQEHGCIFLTASGCALAEAQRPCQCLALIPSLDTLIEGEIRCELSPGGSTAAARKNWQAFWANQPNTLQG